MKSSLLLFAVVACVAGIGHAEEPCCRPQPCRPILFPRLHALLHGCPAPGVIVANPPVPFPTPKEKPINLKGNVFPIEDASFIRVTKDFEADLIEGKYKECLKVIQAAVENDKEKTMKPAEVILAMWLYEAGKKEEGRKMIEEFIAKNPVHPDGYLWNARVDLHEKRITNAVLNSYAAQNFSNQPVFNKDQQKRMRKEARLGLVEAFEIRGDYQSMMEPLQGLVNDDDKNEEYRRKLKEAKEKSGLHDPEIEELKRKFEERQKRK